MGQIKNIIIRFLIIGILLIFVDNQSVNGQNKNQHCQKYLNQSFHYFHHSHHLLASLSVTSGVSSMAFPAAPLDGFRFQHLNRPSFCLPFFYSPLLSCRFLFLPLPFILVLHTIYRFSAHHRILQPFPLFLPMLLHPLPCQFLGFG